MAKCASCKNKNTNARCRNNALAGLTLCGRHAKSKHVRLWADVAGITKSIILISKVWRGYHVRNLIRLAGPGAINRSICNNREELVSMESISSIPFINYFGFEENNKVYGFDVRSIIQCVHREMNPTNPYTRQPFGLEDRKRLREVIGYRIRNKLDNIYDPNIRTAIKDVISNRWLQICQICEENGFLNLPHNMLIDLNKSQLFIFLSMISNDMKSWAAEHKREESQRIAYLIWIKNILRKFHTTYDDTEYSFFVSSMLLSILYHAKDTYSISFIIMSALYRL